MDYSAYDYTGKESFVNDAYRCIKEHKNEFAEYLLGDHSPQILLAIKALKDYSGLGLKECKYCIELYRENKLVNIKEERKIKLEKLAKVPLVDQLMIKIRNLTDNKLHSLLLTLSVDDLLSIDEELENKDK